MSFGGYKFSGLRVDYDSGLTTIERTLVIHRARVKAFMSASALASNAWIFDPDRLTGTITFESTAGAIHALKDGSNNVVGYASFFKHPSGFVGYYLILTSNSCYLDSSSGVNLTADQICHYNSYYAPIKASCFHSISSSPFGDLPTDGAQSDDFLPVQATRIVSIGGNCEDSSKPSALGDSTYSIVSSMSSHVFGYAIKDTDIISFTRKGTKFDSSDGNNFITVLSLNAFSEIYTLNDLNGMLLFPVLGAATSSEFSGLKTTGWTGQVFGRLGNGMTMVNTNGYALMFPDIRAAYEAVGSAIIPLEGAVIAIDGYDVFETGQYAKGCVNPELISLNTTLYVLSSSIFDNYASGLLYICSITSSSPSISCIRYNDTSLANANYAGRGYVNVFIGWDSDNPDIRLEAAWPVFNSSI